MLLIYEEQSKVHIQNEVRLFSINEILSLVTLLLNFIHWTCFLCLTISATSALITSKLFNTLNSIMAVNRSKL